MKWFKRSPKLPSTQKLEERLSQANQRLQEVHNRQPKVDEIVSKLRRHYEENQFAARLIERIVESGR